MPNWESLSVMLVPPTSSNQQCHDKDARATPNGQPDDEVKHLRLLNSPSDTAKRCNLVYAFTQKPILKPQQRTETKKNDKCFHFKSPP